MLFLTYWELNEDIPVGQRLHAAEKLMASGLFPPPNMTILRWDATPDGWGILLAEADSAQNCFNALQLWRTACPGFFKCTRTSPVLPVQQAIASSEEIVQSLAGKR